MHVRLVSFAYVSRMKTSLDMMMSSLIYVVGSGAVGSSGGTGLVLNIACNWVVMVPCKARSCVSAE